MTQRFRTKSHNWESTLSAKNCLYLIVGRCTTYLLIEFSVNLDCKWSDNRKGMSNYVRLLMYPTYLFSYGK